MRRQRSASAPSKPSSTCTVPGSICGESTLRAEAQVRGDHAAALGHAGDFGFLHVVALGDGRLGEDLGRRHDALAADAADQDVGDVVRAHDASWS
jgi:hypothetical protein